VTETAPRTDDALPVPYFCARPRADRATGAAVVVLLEGHGMTLQLLRFCERLADAGYLAMAPDLFARFGGPDNERAASEMWFRNLPDALALTDITAAVLEARGMGATKVGLTGFCNGGRLTYRSAVSGVPIDAAVPYYGGGIAGILGETGCPLLAFFGDRDEWIPNADVEAVRAHHPGDVVLYEGAEHGFMRDGSPNHHPEAAADAWSRMMAFFATHLAG
jgi:carboxymethylenebutenolidase